VSNVEQRTLPYSVASDDHAASQPVSEPGGRRVTSLLDSAPTLAESSHRALGAYYTPSVAAEALAGWALRQPGDRILEPSMGDGAFLAALSRESERRRLGAEIWGVELAADTFAATVGRGVVDPARAIRSDFLAVDPFEVDAVVGNPPYVRLRHVPEGEAGRARCAAAEVLGESMDPSGSLWMPFALHATRFLTRGGRLALVLPFDLTYVRYARPLWAFLGDNFGSLRVVRVHERMFPEILQEVVLLFADDFGGSTHQVAFDAFRTLEQLGRGAADVSVQLPVDQVVDGERVFLEALMPAPARELVSQQLQRLTVPARELVTFNIGYVCGDKGFFHPDDEVIEDYDLPDACLRPALTSSRQVSGFGLRTSAVPNERLDRLFLPSSDSGALTQGETDYIRFGDRSRVSQRYKCRIRDPWYVTPGVKVPDVVVPVFTERPAMLLNDAGVVASNSLLCGYLKVGNAETLASSWYTSLTLLQLELQVHALGGGVMVLVPREAGSIRLIPLQKSVGRNHLGRVHRHLVAGRMDDAFHAGDDMVLHGKVGLSGDEVAAIQDAARELAYWRTAVRSGSDARAAA
jgi:adenine-specific DNA-methyltransferase